MGFPGDTVNLNLPRRKRTFASLSLDRPLIMGVVNATPDSFSDGGLCFEADAAVRHARRLAADGADIIDVGGESTRPGAEPVGVDEECRRVVPIVRALAADGLVVSIDTRRASIMAAAIEAGASIVNDVTALTGDPDALPLVAASSVGVILMHMQGDPRMMQVEPRYADAPRDVYDWLAGRIARCREMGMTPDRIAVDPGIGFGKTVRHNVEILARLWHYRDLDSALVIGVSRKSFIGRLSRDEPPHQRLGGSLAAAVAAVARGADIVRVHDVAATRQALAVWQAIEITDRGG
jgi:dihydropteroate synthase